MIPNRTKAYRALYGFKTGSLLRKLLDTYLTFGLYKKAEQLSPNRIFELIATC